jgi:hypothetical protein
MGTAGTIWCLEQAGSGFVGAKIFPWRILSMTLCRPDERELDAGIQVQS